MSDPLRYTLSFPEPHTHYVEVRAEIPTAGQLSVDLMMAVWTPGSYLIREYARHVEQVLAASREGEPLQVHKSAKNRWTVIAGTASTIIVTYRVYGREMSVRTNWIEADFALINAAPTFLTPPGARSQPHEVRVVRPSTWMSAHSALPGVPGEDDVYLAANYDELVDSPLLLGSPSTYLFKVAGRPHLLVNEGEAGVFDGARAAADVEAIVREHHRFWSVVPYGCYLVLNLITEATGGLEHANSTVLMTSRWATRTRKAYLGWLELASHELFHVWNGKRLRPMELGPFDYEHENYTRSLWVVEGITDYYGDLLVHRAGLSSREELLAGLADKIDAVQNTPGRLVQSMSDASFDTWIKHYRPDENSPNSGMSYYIKGSVVAFLLDMTIREATGHRRSLDDVMREAYARYSGERGYTEEAFRDLAETVAKADLSAFWRATLDEAGELDYAPALTAVGLRFRPVSPVEGAAPPKASLGVTTRIENGRVVVSRVGRGTAAREYGLNVDDELVAIDDFRIRPEQFDQRLEQYSPGDRVSLLVARRDRLVRLENAVLGVDPVKAWQLEIDPNASPRQTACLTAWLAGDLGV